MSTVPQEEGPVTRVQTERRSIFRNRGIRFAGLLIVGAALAAGGWWLGNRGTVPEGEHNDVVADLNAQLAEADTHLADVNDQLTATNSELETTASDLADSREEVDDLQNDLETAQAEVTRLTEEGAAADALAADMADAAETVRAAVDEAVNSLSLFAAFAMTNIEPAHLESFDFDMAIADALVGHLGYEGTWDEYWDRRGATVWELVGMVDSAFADLEDTYWNSPLGSDLEARTFWAVYIGLLDRALIEAMDAADTAGD